MSTSKSVRICASCGRAFEWRRRWAQQWDTVQYCSAACRRQRVGSIDRALEGAILDLLDTCAAGKTICPSEAARHVAARRGIEQWRSLMERTRRAARRLSVRARIEIVQGGRAVDPSRARGAIRLRLCRQPG